MVEFASRAAIFLDRDGVIIENRADYVRRWTDVDCYPQALAALSQLREWPGKIIIVTNQSVVGRGLISLQEAQTINKRLIDVISSAGGRVDAVFMCPHAPAANCSCRKPRPGLLKEAVKRFNIDPAQSIMIGDALTDIAAARAAGVGRVALVRTGRGEAQLRLPAAHSATPFPIYDTLTDALQEMVLQEGAAVDGRCS